MKECAKFINLRREAYTSRLKIENIAKLEQLCHKNRGGHPNVQHGRHGRQELIDTSSPEIPKQQGKTQKRVQISKKDGLSIYQVNH